MKVRIELDEHLAETEVVIRASSLTEDVLRLQDVLHQSENASLIFYKGSGEYFVDLADILFFETADNKVYGHTKDEAYEVKEKLYELEERLAGYFCRISKSAVVNIKQIYALNRSFSGSSCIRFYDTDKEVYVSRHYYRPLKEKLQEMR